MNRQELLAWAGFTEASYAEYRSPEATAARLEALAKAPWVRHDEKWKAELIEKARRLRENNTP